MSVAEHSCLYDSDIAVAHHASQVMLAQQRTIIQLVELVNVLHGEAASQVSKLTGQQPAVASDIPPDTAAGSVSEEPDRQLTADQQLVQQR